MSGGDVNGNVAFLRGGKVISVITDPKGENDKILSDDNIKKYLIFND